MIIAVGFAVSFSVSPFVLAAILVVMQVAAEAAGLYAIPFGFAILGLGTVIVSSLPAYFMSRWAMRIPRVVRLRCSRCSWSDSFLVNRAGKVLSDPTDCIKEDNK